MIAKGVFFRENVQPKAVRYGQTPPANQVLCTIFTCCAAGPVIGGRLAVINVVKVVCLDIPNQRGEFPAGVHFSIRQ